KIQKIICVSNEVKKNFIPFIDAEKLEIVYPGIDVKKFENNKISTIKKNKKEFTVGIVSALETEKNIEEFIEIANKLLHQRNDITFVIIGDGSLKKMYENQHSNLKFLGFQQNIPQQLSKFDVFLFTSKNEGFGQVLLEAMAAKIPVVTNNFAAAHEIIAHEKTGYIYKSVDDAVSIIDKLLTNHNLRLTTTQNAFNFVQQFDITLMNKKIENIYNSIFTNHQLTNYK
ncbi:MAG TPA: glycosyltransferase family 4 protein, partial [Chitinophagales bacterium]|nr:glycosyltransferase family 4 protein [Chitinophagales bacterium]